MTAAIELHRRRHRDIVGDLEGQAHVRTHRFRPAVSVAGLSVTMAATPMASREDDARLER